MTNHNKSGRNTTTRGTTGMDCSTKNQQQEDNDKSQREWWEHNDERYHWHGSLNREPTTRGDDDQRACIDNNVTSQPWIQRDRCLATRVHNDRINNRSATLSVNDPAAFPRSKTTRKLLREDKRSGSEVPWINETNSQSVLREGKRSGSEVPDY
jgi:hypothetical protein